jgi:hypothetical protein
MSQHWQSAFQVGRAEIGQILFYVLAAVGIFMFLIGRWQEKIGPSWLSVIGIVICGTSTIAVGYVTGIKAVYLWASIIGVSSAFIYLPALTVAQRWYPHRRGLVSGQFVFWPFRSHYGPYLQPHVATPRVYIHDIDAGCVGVEYRFAGRCIRSFPPKNGHRRNRSSASIADGPAFFIGQAKFANSIFLVFVAYMGFRRCCRNLHGNAFHRVWYFKGIAHGACGFNFDSI